MQRLDGAQEARYHQRRMDPRVPALTTTLDPEAEKRLKRGLLGAGMLFGGVLTAGGMIGFAGGNQKAGYAFTVAGLVFTTVTGIIRLYEE